MESKPQAGATVLLFVYGTLMRDGCRASVLAGQRFLGRASTQPVYDLYCLGTYPGLVARAAGGRSIEGELYEVDMSLLPQLDRIEGAPLLFRREPVAIKGRREPVVAYLYQQDLAGCAPWPGTRWSNEAV